MAWAFGRDGLRGTRRALLVAGLCLSSSVAAVDIDPRYGRASIHYLTPGVAKLIRPDDPHRLWKIRVAQDIGAWIGAQTWSLRIMAQSRLKPGLDCLKTRIGDEAALSWAETALRLQLREKADLDRWEAAREAAGTWPPGPQENCQKDPSLFRS